VSLTMGTVDMGQGSDTAMAQIVAETMNIRTEDIRVVHPDTDLRPTTWRRWDRARLSTWAMPSSSPPNMRATSSSNWPAVRA